MPTVEQDNEVARAAHLARMRAERDAFLTTFGPPGNRTVHGAIILTCLERLCGKTIPKNQLDNNGRTDALQTHRVLGHWDVLQVILETIEWKETHVNTSSERT